MILILLAAYLLQWQPSPDTPVVYGVFRSSNNIEWERIIETVDTCHIDTVSADIRYYYRIGTRWGYEDVFVYTDIISGATIDLCPDDSVSNFIVVRHGDDALGIHLPHGLWLSSWELARPDIEIPEIFEARYVWDYNCNGVLDISDFSRFAETDYTPDDKDAFLAMYGKQTVRLVHIQ